MTKFLDEYNILAEMPSALLFTYESPLIYYSDEILKLHIPFMVNNNPLHMSMETPEIITADNATKSYFTAAVTRHAK